MTFVIYGYNLKVMGIFSKEEPITKEYLESSGFVLTVKQFGVVYKLEIKARYKYSSHKCYYYYFPKAQCEVDGILHEISMLEVRYYNQDFKTVTETIKMDIPKTQFDIDTMILKCIKIVNDKCKDAEKIFTKPIK